MATHEFGFKPATIGTSSSAPLTDTRVHRNTSGVQALNTIPLVHLVQPGQRLKILNAGGRASTNGVLAAGAFCVYETDSTGMTQTNLVTKGMQVTTTSSTISWLANSSIDFDLTPWAGKYIKPGVQSDDGQFRRCNVSGGVAGDMVSSTNGTGPNPFGTAANQTSLYPIYFVVEDGAGLSDINGGNPVIPGQPFTWAPTFTPTSGSIGGLSLSGVSLSGATAPGYVDGEPILLPGTRTVTAIDGSATASANATVGVIPGYTYTVLEPGFDEGNYSVVQGAGASDGWFVIHPDTDVVGTDALLKTNAEGSRTYWLGDPVSGNGYSYTVTTGEDGSVTVSRSLTSAGITASGITGRGITGIGI